MRFEGPGRQTPGLRILKMGQPIKPAKSFYHSDDGETHSAAQNGLRASDIILPIRKRLRSSIGQTLAQEAYLADTGSLGLRPVHVARLVIGYPRRFYEGTVARMQTEYVIPLQGKRASRVDQLASDIRTATSRRNAVTKERNKLIEQQAELQAYDVKPRHDVGMRITVDLVDGIKFNDGKFGNLLAEVKGVCGASDEE